MQAPKISIVIPVYNGANYLPQAIDSALAQDYPNKEILVINDGSNDNGQTAEVARSYGDRIRYFEKENGGVASALNLGIEKMEGEYFSWLSHDDIYLPHKLSRQMRLVQKCGDPCQIVAGGYYIVNEDLKPVGLMDFHVLYPKDKLEIPLFPVFHCAVNGCTMLIHKSHFERVGVFDESLPTTQDYDLWFRMLRGKKLMYTRSLDVLSRVHSGQTSVSMLEQHNIECSQLWISLLELLTEQEKKEIGGTIQDFYMKIYTHFSRHTTYAAVVDYVKQFVPSSMKMLEPSLRDKIPYYRNRLSFFITRSINIPAKVRKEIIGRRTNPND